ncbi:MAG: S8 family serine peptidase, partial [Calditrichota bacterium]
MGLANAGTLTPGLTDAYSRAADPELLPVLITLADSASASRMAEQLATEGLPLAQIHQRVMDSLTSQAAARPAELLRLLETMTTNGTARAVRPFWITNVIAAELTRSAAETLVEQTGIEEIGLDETVTLQRNQPLLSDGGAQSLSAIGALDVWLKGTRGDGCIVCVIGDGLASTHPALKNNWRGKTAPASECWYDKNGGPPASCGSESSYLLGLLCGAPAGNNPATGVAPAANWIAANIFCAGTARLSDVLAAYQWAADPDGNSATVNDVPDAILSPWQVNSDCLGAEPSHVWQFVANLEALGPLPVFAASSLQAPASLPQCFTIGNLDIRGGQSMPEASAPQGPSPCDPRITKPDLSAPGAAVHTTGETGYVDVTG